MTTQTHDPVIETKICQHCGSSFDITQSDMDFYAKISPKFGDYTAEIPTPTLCPDCRQRRRLAFRNERKLYRRICDASQQPIISIYSPDKSYTVYDQKIRRSDARDALDYGRNFDFSRTFTEQFGEIYSIVPLPGLYNFFAENSDYCNCSNYQKDCYLTSSAAQNEKCYYGAYINSSTDVIDAFMTFNTQSSYVTIDCHDCSHLFYGSNVRNSSHSSFLTNCNNCHHCYGCDSLENASYCIDNIQYSKEEYERKITTKDNQQSYMKWLQMKQKDTSHAIVDCVHSHHLFNAKNSTNCNDGGNLENCSHTSWFYDGDNCMDIYARGNKGSYCYESVGIGDNTYSLLFCSSVDTNINNVFYSLHCSSSSHLFGCIGLRNKEYCIFNKQYTKEEYNKLVPQIIEHMKKTGEWGEFFHPSLSPFGYNETVANEYFPAQKAPSGKLEAVSSDGEAGSLELSTYGYKRSDYEAPAPQVDKIVPGEKLPAQGCKIIQEKKPEFLQDILKYAIRCEKSQKLFRLIPQEIAFYTKHDLPLPRRHPDVRHAERMEMRR